MGPLLVLGRGRVHPPPQVQQFHPGTQRRHQCVQRRRHNRTDNIPLGVEIAERRRNEHGNDSHQNPRTSISSARTTNCALPSHYNPSLPGIGA